ncbi:hypothetical protein IWX50DRAFT_87983 [Phyllosticta citricarpa]
MSTRSNAEPQFVGLFRRLSAVLPVKLNRRRGASGTEEELNCQAGGRQVWTVLLLSCTLCTTITADRTRLEMKQKKFGEGNREEILKKTSKKRRKRRRRIKHYIYTPPSPYVASMASIHVVWHGILARGLACRCDQLPCMCVYMYVCMYVHLGYIQCRMNTDILLYIAYHSTYLPIGRDIGSPACLNHAESIVWYVQHMYIFCCWRGKQTDRVRVLGESSLSVCLSVCLGVWACQPRTRGGGGINRGTPPPCRRTVMVHG